MAYKEFQKKWIAIDNDNKLKGMITIIESVKGIKTYHLKSFHKGKGIPKTKKIKFKDILLNYCHQGDINEQYY